jgi:hypothetical protein
MASVISLYNHTRQRYFLGANSITDQYRINLYSALPFNASATTKATAETGATQLSTAHGYTQNAMIISGMDAEIISVEHAKIVAANVLWSAAGGDIAAAFAMMWNNTDNAPVLHIDFDGTVTAVDGDSFPIVWPTDGIITTLP